MGALPRNPAPAPTHYGGAMKKLTRGPQACVLALLVGSLAAGCSSTPSNTQRGAAGGAALGALAGAVIGNNRGSGNAASGAAIGAAAGAIAGGALGNRADRREANASYPSNDPAVTNIYVTDAPPVPPAPRAEAVTPQPTSGAVWIPGYWSYESGRNYEWVAGHWEIPPAGTRTFQPPEWRRQNNGYVYVRGHWR